ncbi:MAG TPA: phospholipase D-like domain-containing protein [Petrotogaceae bacterium]|nr:phospholipase D-like domain-containing protein [Petrotogaceae bacterium]
MKKSLLLICFLVFPLILSLGYKTDIYLSKGDYINISDMDTPSYMPPGSIYADRNFFFRASSSQATYTLFTAQDSWNIFINDPSLDATVLFYDFDTQQKNLSNIKYLESLIDDAKRYIYISIYDINHSTIADALKRAAQKGIEVKMVTETQNQNTFTSLSLPRNNVKVLFDTNSALMHDKFIVIDGYCLVTGSTNLTNNCLEYNSNNMIFIFNNEIAENYVQEFKEQFEQKIFGKKAGTEKPFPSVLTDVGTISTYFTPEDNLKQEILKNIKECTKNIYMMIFTFTDPDIAQELICASERGVEVKVITEEFQSKASYAAYNILKGKIDIILDKNSKTFHHKVIIFDDNKVLTGSFNFTGAAQDKNDENSLIIESNYINTVYTDEFKRLWGSYTK